MSNDKNLVVNSWVDEFSKFIALESIKMLASGAKEKSPETGKRMVTRFLQHYIQQIVLSSFLEHASDPSLSKQQKYEITAQNFALMKMDIQIEVAEAFSSACKNFTGMNVDYFCQIKPVGEPRTKVVS